MLRENRSKSTFLDLKKTQKYTYLYSGVLGSDFYPRTGLKPYSTRGITDQLFPIVLGFFLYSKMLAENWLNYRYLLLISKNKGTNPGTATPPLCGKTPVRLSSQGVPGYFCDPRTGEEVFHQMVPDGTRYPNTPSRDRFLTGKYPSGAHLEAEAGQELPREIFNKSMLMLKIWFLPVNLVVSKIAKVKTQIAIAGFTGFYPKLYKVKRYGLKAGQVFKLRGEKYGQNALR